MNVVIFDPAFAWQILPRLLQAFVVTVQASLLGFAIAVVVGLVLAFLRRSERAWIRYPVVGMLEFVRSTPFLLQLYFMYFVLPLYGVTLGPMTIGVIALGAHYATYTAEVYRAGIEGVAKGQWEAATALNYGILDRWRRIILPQAIPPMVPVLGNYLITIFKETPLLTAITVAEVMHEASLIGADSYKFMEPMTLVGALMLAISLVSAYGVRRLDAYFRTRRGAPHAGHG
ncbi:MAG: ectoine/hydroxyectoine ABC transporter permease subunit EhuD [Rhodospirillales bacterium]|nr:ectoine/hydroxyectoine ABC transporter permease subunit EhuD [Rhodospirillales bacterium]